MKVLSWNVNGLRAVMRKGFEDFLSSYSPDFLCVQETKVNSALFSFDGYHSFWSFADRKGYSGVLSLSRLKPLSVFGLPSDSEGRVLVLEFEDFFLVNVYVPNAQRGLVRLSYRLEWDSAFLDFLSSLKREKDVVVCGDFNVAHTELDIKNPRSNLRNPGFTVEERESFSRLLSSGFVDTFRALHPSLVKYSWWSYRFNARERNIGWRIDYVLVSRSFFSRVVDAFVLDEVFGSDHCPVGVVFK